MARRPIAPRTGGKAKRVGPRRVTAGAEPSTVATLAEQWATPANIHPLDALEHLLAIANGRRRFYDALIRDALDELGPAALAVAVGRWGDFERNDLIDLEHRERDTAARLAKDLASVHSILERIARVELGHLVAALADLRADERLALTPDQQDALAVVLTERFARWEQPRRTIGPILDVA